MTTPIVPSANSNAVLDSVLQEDYLSAIKNSAVARVAWRDAIAQLQSLQEENTSLKLQVQALQGELAKHDPTAPVPSGVGDVSNG